ncbi:BgTH12-07020 [Blumeria graminis f. sp. triticale]|uniref:BgTH12-07020 n=1 Tax=Blumeria graminis f. sp. triticale TaxID=1689686 RepID=A0A9W4D8Q5_BLUGR|nr:BgTH12-07020 [Blumeria graminis f. sp. triticale]
MENLFKSQYSLPPSDTMSSEQLGIAWLNFPNSPEKRTPQPLVRKSKVVCGQKSSFLSQPGHSRLEDVEEGLRQGKRWGEPNVERNPPKRRRGPNKNQKVLTEEERKRKKEKALCRNAESARTCRGKRKQAEERLKSMSLNMEREFHQLCQIRGELSQELFTLLEQARKIKDPPLAEALDQATARLSALIVPCQDWPKILEISPRWPPTSPYPSRHRANSSTHSKDNAVDIPPAIKCPLPDSEGTHVENNSPGQCSDLAKLRSGSSTRHSPQIESNVSNINTPISMVSLATDDEAVALQYQLANSPNPFMDEIIPHDGFVRVPSGEFQASARASVSGQPIGDGKSLGYVFPLSPLPQLNEQYCSPFNSPLFTHPTPPPFDFNTRTSFVNPFSHTFSDQPLAQVSPESTGSHQLECAIAQLANYT